MLKCFADGMMIDVTLWNRDIIPEEIISKWIVFNGFRIKKITEASFVLVSTVYSRMDFHQGEVGKEYDSNKNYHCVSVTYQRRTIEELTKILDKIERESSILTVKLNQA